MNQVFPQEKDYLSKAGNVISIFLICSWLLSRSNPISSQKTYLLFNKFFENFAAKAKTDIDYINYNLYSIQSTSGAESIKNRDEILRRHIFLEEPTLLRCLNADDVVIFKNKMEDSFGKKVELIHILIQDINERAISKGRTGIFDFTAESSSVFLILSK